MSSRRARALSRKTEMWQFMVFDLATGLIAFGVMVLLYVAVTSTHVGPLQ